jgi:hypothetical protein
MAKEHWIELELFFVDAVWYLPMAAMMGEIYFVVCHTQYLLQSTE